MTNDLLSAIDDGKISVIVLLDLSAAFDTIDHEILLHRLHNVFGYGDTVLSWFQSYLENQTQTVVVHGKHSTPASLRYGVPQGSVLGPILFILYPQPLSNVIQHYPVFHKNVGKYIHFGKGNLDICQKCLRKLCYLKYCNT